MGFFLEGWCGKARLAPFCINLPLNPYADCSWINTPGFGAVGAGFYYYNDLFECDRPNRLVKQLTGPADLCFQCIGWPDEIVIEPCDLEDVGGKDGDPEDEDRFCMCYREILGDGFGAGI